MGKYKEYNNQGARALYTYTAERFLDSIEEIEFQYSHSYNDETLLPSIREKTEQCIKGIKEGSEYGLLNILNKNPFWDFSFGVIGEEILANQQKINEFFRNLKDKEGISLFERGYDESLFLRAISQSQANGLFGEKSGTKTLIDKVMIDLPYIVSAAASKNPNIIMASLFASSMGITPESVGEAYQQSGFKGVGGVLEHIVSSIKDSPQGSQLLELGKLKLQERIEKKGFGIDLSELDLDNCLTAYKLYGFDGKQGIVNVIATSILANQKGLGGIFFLKYIKEFADKDIEALREVFKIEYRFEENPHLRIIKEFAFKMYEGLEGDQMSDLEKNILNELKKEKESKPFMRFVMENPPAPLQDNALHSHIKQYGVIGESGLFAYIKESVPQVMAPFEKVGLIEIEEVKNLQEKYEEISKITDAAELLIAFNYLISPTLSLKGKKLREPCVDLAIRAENHGVSAYEFLTEQEFETEKNEWLEKNFKKTKISKEILPVIGAGLERIVYSSDIIKTIEEALTGKKDKEKSLKSVISYIKLQTERNPDYPEKIRDYLRLIKDISATLSKELA